MSLGIAYTGIPNSEELANCKGIASQLRMQKGPVAHIECIECVPCNPCESACPFGAIKIGDAISNTPVLDEDKCIGCGNCIGKCSGLAITVINKAYSADMVSLELPYEYLPVPVCGEALNAVDRTGAIVCKAKIEKVRKDHGTCIVTIVFDKEYADVVKSIRQ